MFADGWDVERDQRLARQIAMGLVPEGTVLPPRNDFVQPWSAHTDNERTVFARLAAAYAAMLDHADQHLGRLVDFLRVSGQLENTLVLVLSDNGASQEGGPNGFVNAMGPYNGIPETLDDRLRRLVEIGGPDTHSNFPWGWAMASNTPLKRYKQNTHGGGIRDPLVVSWPSKIAPAGEVRRAFCHASDLVPTLLEAIGVAPPESVNGVAQQPIEGTSFVSTFADDEAPVAKQVQYFEMFGHRGIWMDGWKAVAYHQQGTPFEADRWELYHLDQDFAEVNDLALVEPERLQAMIARWWNEAEANDVLPLDDRFAERFAENAARVHAGRLRYEFWAGMGHLPSDVAPDLRSRSYRITAHVTLVNEHESGVLIAHGDSTSGYSLYLRDGVLVHDLNIGGSHQVVTASRSVGVGTHELAFVMHRDGRHGTGTLLIDGASVGSMETSDLFHLFISWSGLDIGFDRGSPVGRYPSPNRFTGTLHRVVVDMTNDQTLDHDAAGHIQLARE
jgi:Sulfatase